MFVFRFQQVYAQNVVVRAIGGMDSSNVFVGLKDSLNPDIYIDGIKYDHKIVDLIDPDKIQSINVLKGEAAIKEYNAPNGVILITSKKEDKNNEIGTQIRVKGYAAIILNHQW